MSYIAERSRKKAFTRTISPELASHTIEDDRIPAETLVKRCTAEKDMTVGCLVIASGERFYLVSVAAVTPHFPHRYFAVVERGGEYLVSCGNTKTVGCLIMQNGKHVASSKKITNPSAAVAIELVKQHRASHKVKTAEVVTSEVTTSPIETQATRIPAGTTIYRTGGQVLCYEDLFQAWFCTCQEASDGSGVFYENCEHTERVIASIAAKEVAA